MTVTISKSALSGDCTAPPSKSMAHRLLICAALTRKKCIIGNIAMSDDIKATLGCLESLGAEFTQTGDSITVDGSGIFTKNDRLFCNESGSTLRFMLPLCLVSGKETVLCGTERLFARSLDIYKELCGERGIGFYQDSTSVTVKGVLKSGTFSVRGDVSSQFISGLLYLLPLLEGDSVIEIVGKLESAPYIDMTIFAQKMFGVSVVRDKNTIKIKGDQQYIPINTSVEGDCSNAAFFEALALLGHGVRVSGLDKNTLQGDYIFYDYFDKLKDGTPTLDVSDCPDLAPILMAVAAAKNGVTLIGTARLKIKESDRGTAMAKELAKFGVEVKLFDNKIEVGHGLKTPAQTLDGHNDHRIVMACAVLCTVTGGTVTGAQAVNKSFPDFFERMIALGAEVRYET